VDMLSAHSRQLHYFSVNSSANMGSVVEKVILVARTYARPTMRIGNIHAYYILIFELFITSLFINQSTSAQRYEVN
jgi:hypothetical protein